MKSLLDTFSGCVRNHCDRGYQRAWNSLETHDAVSIIEAADQAAKTATDVIELLVIAKGMREKSYVMITGEVSAVEVSHSEAKRAVADSNVSLTLLVIAHPRRMIDSIL